MALSPRSAAHCIMLCRWKSSFLPSLVCGILFDWTRFALTYPGPCIREQDAKAFLCKVMIVGEDVGEAL